MKVEIKVPAMGESISEATVGAILKPSGSAVAADDEILELETDKVNQVLYAPQGGVLTLNVAPEQVVKIGQVVGYVETEKEEAKAQQKEPQKPQEPQKTKEKKEILADTPVLPPAGAKESKKQPVAEPSLRLSEGSARMTKEAYLADMMSSARPEVSPGEISPSAVLSGKEQRETRKKMSKLRKVIGDRLVESLRTTAMLTTFNEVDMSQVMLLREKYKETFTKEHGVRLGFLSFFVKAVVSALMDFPAFNSYIEGDEIVHREYYDIGIAVGTDRGLFVPVVRECDKLTYAEIEKAIEAYAIKVKEGSIAVDDLQGGGFTITNGGVYGSLLSTPILNPPQCGILGMHKIEKRPVVVNDQIVIKPMMYLALSYDHRVVDGKEAVSFLVHIKNQLEDPVRQLLEI